MSRQPVQTQQTPAAEPAAPVAAAESVTASVLEAPASVDVEIAASFAAASSYIEAYEAGARDSAILWVNVPPRYANWHFFRCGVKSSARAQTLAAANRLMGYLPAAPGVRPHGAFGTDGNEGLYQMCPPEVFERIQAFKRALNAKRQARRRGVLGEQLDEMRHELRRRGKKPEVRLVDESTGREVDPGEAFDEMMMRRR